MGFQCLADRLRVTGCCGSALEEEECGVSRQRVRLPRWQITGPTMAGTLLGIPEGPRCRGKLRTRGAAQVWRPDGRPAPKSVRASEARPANETHNNETITVNPLQSDDGDRGRCRITGLDRVAVRLQLSDACRRFCGARGVAARQYRECATCLPSCGTNSCSGLQRLTVGHNFQMPRTRPPVLQTDRRGPQRCRPPMMPWHIVRIRSKRARHIAELSEAVLGRPASRFLRAAKKLQDILGADQGAVAAERRLGSLLGEAPSSRVAFGSGSLTEPQRTRRLAALETFAAVWRRRRRRGETVSR
jgi:hypothetical protein